MRCPRCGHDGSDRFRPPKGIQGALLRRHRCRSCGLLFLSAQVVVEGPLLERLLPLLER